MTLRSKRPFLVWNETTLTDSNNTKTGLTKTLIFLRGRMDGLGWEYDCTEVSRGYFRTWDLGKPQKAWIQFQ